MKQNLSRLILSLSILPIILAETTWAALEILRPRSIHRISVEPRSGAGKTYFDLAQESYRRGTSFDPKSVSGVYVGRCYYADGPMRPIASIVVISQEDENSSWSEYETLLATGSVGRSRFFARAVRQIGFK